MLNPATAPGRSDAEWQALLAAQVAAHGRLCFRVAQRIVGEPAAAEDACQQAFLKAWEQRHRIHEPAALKAWILRVVTNESLQMLRRSKMQDRVLAPGRAGRPEQAEPAPDHRSALRESVLLALEELPETTRLVVLLRVMEGYSGNEVKDMLGCSASEVSRRLHDGFATLRGALAEWSSSGRG